MSEAAHAKLSPSGAHRWMACPASVALEAEFPDENSSFAQEGTIAHELAELCLSQGISGSDAEQHGYIDSEMHANVDEYLEYVRSIPGTLFVEQRIDFSKWVPNGWGTADAIVLDGTTLNVIDLKYGRGVKVDAPDNPQALCYALGAVAGFEFIAEIETVKIAIVQPRLNHISEWEISVTDLVDWADNALAVAATAALQDDAPFNPGEKQCRFCKAKATCRALAEHNLPIVVEGFSNIEDDFTPFDPRNLSNEELAFVLSKVDLIKQWANAVEAHAQSELEAGRKVEGFKLVAGRSNRRWADEEEAETVLRKKAKVADIFTKKLISPAQAEKLLGKKRASEIADLITKPTGAPTIAPIGDKRPAIEINPSDGFDAIGLPQAA